MKAKTRSGLSTNCFPCRYHPYIGKPGEVVREYRHGSVQCYDLKYSDGVVLGFYFNEIKFVDGEPT